MTNEQMEAILCRIVANDKTPEYEYGEATRNGKRPDAGARWLTPREIARRALALMHKEEA